MSMSTHWRNRFGLLGLVCRNGMRKRLRRIASMDASHEIMPRFEALEPRMLLSVTVLVDAGATWAYLDNGTDQGGDGEFDPEDDTWFASPDYDDSG